MYFSRLWIAPLVLCLVTVAACTDSSAPQTNPGSQWVQVDDWTFTGYPAESDAHWPDFSSTEGRWDDSYPWDCEGLTGDHAFACFEQRFWQSIGFDFEGRTDVYDLLGTFIDQFERGGGLTDIQLGLLYFRRVHLAVALGIENNNDDVVTLVLSDLETALAYLPEDTPVYKMVDSFKLQVDIFIPFAVEFFADKRDEALELLAQLEVLADTGDPASIYLFVTAAQALPISTGWPTKVGTYIEQFLEKCDTEYCLGPSPRAPFGWHGSYWVFGDIYARIGDLENATKLYQRALHEENSENWPSRPALEYELSHLEERIAAYQSVDDSEPVVDLTTSNGPFGCVMCHQPQGSTGAPSAGAALLGQSK